MKAPPPLNREIHIKVNDTFLARIDDATRLLAAQGVITTRSDFMRQAALAAARQVLADRSEA